MIQLPSSFSLQEFKRAGLDHMDGLLGELEQMIQGATDEITGTSKRDGEKIEGLEQLWESVCSQLRELGHDLHSHDCGSDARLDHNYQVWGQNYTLAVQNGLHLLFQSHTVTVSWIIRRQNQELAAELK